MNETNEGFKIETIDIDRVLGHNHGINLEEKSETEFVGIYNLGINYRNAWDVRILNVLLVILFGFVFNYLTTLSNSKPIQVTTGRVFIGFGILLFLYSIFPSRRESTCQLTRLNATAFRYVIHSFTFLTASTFLLFEVYAFVPGQHDKDIYILGIVSTSLLPMLLTSGHIMMKLREVRFRAELTGYEEFELLCEVIKGYIEALNRGYDYKIEFASLNAVPRIKLRLYFITTLLIIGIGAVLISAISNNGITGLQSDIATLTAVLSAYWIYILSPLIKGSLMLAVRSNVLADSYWFTRVDIMSKYGFLSYDSGMPVCFVYRGMECACGVEKLKEEISILSCEEFLKFEGRRFVCVVVEDAHEGIKAVKHTIDNLHARAFFVKNRLCLNCAYYSAKAGNCDVVIRKSYTTTIMVVNE